MACDRSACAGSTGHVEAIRRRRSTHKLAANSPHRDRSRARMRSDLLRSLDPVAASFVALPRAHLIMSDCQQLLDGGHSDCEISTGSCKKLVAAFQNTPYSSIKPVVVQAPPADAEPGGGQDSRIIGVRSEEGI